MAFLHEIFNNPFAKKALAQVDVPIWISDNLNPDLVSDLIRLKHLSDIYT